MSYRYTWIRTGWKIFIGNSRFYDVRKHDFRIRRRFVYFFVVTEYSYILLHIYVARIFVEITYS